MTGTSLLRLLLLLVLLCAESIVLGLTHHRHTSDGGGGDPDGADVSQPVSQTELVQCNPIPIMSGTQKRALTDPYLHRPVTYPLLTPSRRHSVSDSYPARNKA
ncbi:hypothetical protein RP20_CCG007459 [Aedes albopictus]|nr:hypothetical protein RP20_CCG007459 [Aedes albopictus]